LMLSASATEDPPNFCTIKATGGYSWDEVVRDGRGLRQS
jgi:hypothetical protein